MFNYINYAIKISKFIPTILRTKGQSRYLFRWLRSLRPNYLLNAPYPWLTFEAVDFLKKNLSPGFRVFEYGSGGSTLFWLSFEPTQVISIEHNPAWLNIVSRKLETYSCVDYRLILPEPARIDQVSPELSDPDSYLSADPNFLNCTFRQYVMQVDPFPDGYFDVILIDGRARASCIKHSARKVKSKGILILDNSDRVYYTQKTKSYLRDFQGKIFSGVIPSSLVLSTTTVYTKQETSS